MNSEKILKSVSEVQIQQIRNATVKVSYNGKIFLIDPWLAPKGAMGSFNSLNADFTPANSEKADIFMPMCELPFSVDKILKDVDYYILTHVHPDHFDLNHYNEVLDRNIPIFVQNEEDYNFIKSLGFKEIEILQYNGSIRDNIKLTKINGIHGSLVPCGKSCGVVFQSQDKPTIYFSGDTIMCKEVENAIKIFNPDIIVINGADAELTTFGHLIMDDKAVESIHKLIPNAKIIVSHLDNVAHGNITRKIMHKKLAEKGIEDKILIPEDGEIYTFQNKKIDK